VGAVVGGIPSTCHALATHRDVLEATRAAATIVVPADTRPGQLLVAGALVHGAISLGWALVLARLLPPRHPTVAGALAGLGIGALDLGIAQRAVPPVAALPLVPQLADHVVFGASVGYVLAQRRDTCAAR
jgi:hypothetical protein